MAESIFPKEMLGAITPEYIKGKLFSFHNSAHSLHLDTRSFAEHKALDELYTELVSFKDEILEKLMGYLGGKRIGVAKLDPIPVYSEGASLALMNEILSFSYKVYEWAGEKHYCDIENTAQALSGLAAKIKYLLTLS